MPVVVDEASWSAGEGGDGRTAGRSSGSGSRNRRTSLSAYDAGVLTAKGRKMVAYYEEVAAAVGDGKQVIEPAQRPGAGRR